MGPRVPKVRDKECIKIKERVNLEEKERDVEDNKRVGMSAKWREKSIRER